MIRFALVAVAAALLLPATALAAPPNDAFADAAAVGPLPFADTLDLAGATTEPGEQQWCNFQSQSVWYVLRPAQATAARIDALGSEFGVVFNVYRSFGPGLGGLSFQQCAGFGGTVTLTMEAGATYFVQAGSVSPGAALLELHVNEVPRPANDDFAAAAEVGSLPFTHTVDTAAATSEAQEPFPTCGTGIGAGSVWYRYTPAEDGSVTADVGGSLSAAVTAYTGSSFADLRSLGCRVFSDRLTFRAAAGTTYWFQAAPLFGSRGLLRFALDVAPAPSAAFFTSPPDPSAFDAVQFLSQSQDPAQVGIASQAWDFGDGATSTAGSPTHTYGADGDYTVKLTVTTHDGRTATGSQVVHVETHDVAILHFDVPARGSVGRTARITATVTNQRLPETVEVQLFRSIPGPAEFELVGTLRQQVPVRGARRGTPFAFSYTYTSEDAARNRVTFKAVARIVTARDAVPGDNTAIDTTTRVNG
jgi:hypothetical protein